MGTKLQTLVNVNSLFYWQEWRQLCTSLQANCNIKCSIKQEVKFEWFKLMEIIISDAQMHRQFYCVYGGNLFLTNNLSCAIRKVIRRGRNRIISAKRLNEENKLSFICIIKLLQQYEIVYPKFDQSNSHFALKPPVKISMMH